MRKPGKKDLADVHNIELVLIIPVCFAINEQRILRAPAIMLSDNRAVYDVKCARPQGEGVGKVVIFCGRPLWPTLMSTIHRLKLSFLFSVMKKTAFYIQFPTGIYQQLHAYYSSC